MRRSTLLMCALLVSTTFGCDQVKKQVATIQQKVDLARQRFFGKKAPPPPAPVKPVAPPPAPPPPPPPPAPVAQTPRVRDVPYTSEDTGTVMPGMSERDVYSLWGRPVAARRLGEYTYLFFQNGCERSCGTLDVVTLQNGQVVDAIVRWPGHGYGGQSTSPMGGRQPVGGDGGGDSLRMPDTTQTKAP